MSDEAETFTMPLAGREVEFRRAHIGQVMMLQRTAIRSINDAERGGADKTVRVEAVTKGIVKVLDFIDKLIVNDEDREFIEDKMLEGAITWEQLAAVLSGGKQPDRIPDDQAPRPTKAVKKSPKAAPAAKTVAARGRAKR